MKPQTAWQQSQGYSQYSDGYHQGVGRHSNRYEPGNKPMFTSKTDMAAHLHKHGLLSHEEWTNQLAAIAEAYDKGFTPGRRVYRIADAADFKDGTATEDDIGHIIGFSARPTTLDKVVGLFYYPLLVKWGKPDHSKYRMAYSYPVSELMLYEDPAPSQTTVGDPGQAG